MFLSCESTGGVVLEGWGDTRRGSVLIATTVALPTTPTYLFPSMNPPKHQIRTLDYPTSAPTPTPDPDPTLSPNDSLTQVTGTPYPLMT
eukprot:747253-Hanusia_phi.AAC.1